MSSLGQVFRVRVCNIKANGIQSNGRAEPPYCIKANFDGRAFNTEHFYGTNMSPMWAADVAFEYHVPTVDLLHKKYLVAECYGGDVFIGMFQVDLMTIARGSPLIQMDLKDGSRFAGTLFMEIHMELVANVSIRISRLMLTQLSERGYESSPNPYLAYALLGSGSPIESPIAPNSVRPEWHQLPPMAFRCTFSELCTARIGVDLKHSRNGHTAGVHDPRMASFAIAFEEFPISAGSDGQYPMRMMVHSVPDYPFPFSAELTGTLELRFVHLVAQQALSPQHAPSMAGSMVLSSAPMIHSSPLAVRGGVDRTLALSGVSLAPPSNVHVRHVSPTRGRSGSFSHANAEAALRPMPTSEDISVLESVSADQSALLAKVQGRLADIRARKLELQASLEESRRHQEAIRQANAVRKATLEGDLAAANNERARLEDALHAVQIRMEEEKRLSAQRVADRERARRALEEERQEAALMQQRVLKLRNSMHAHLAEEEKRYQQRLREAEDARRRAMQDTAALAALEQRLSDTEVRFGRR